LRALSVMCIAAPIAAFAQTAIDIGTVSASGTGTGQSAAVPEAAKIAVSQGSLDARSAESIVSDTYVRNYTSPVADYSQVYLMTPGAFSYSPNGVGQGNAGTVVRGLTDSQYLITFDGIPFNDTNGVSHHSYLFFPAQAVGGAVVDRSPGSAATIGQATFGGSLNLLSRTLDNTEGTSVTGSYGSWATTLLDVQHQTGNFGQDGAQNLMFDVQQMNSDGALTYNAQDRRAFSAKYRYVVSSDTVVTAFTSYMDVKNKTPNNGQATVAQINEYGTSYLDGTNPSLPNYYGYNFYEVKTLFSYVDVTSNLGGGWKLDDKVYNYGYHNKQNYPGSTIPTSDVNNAADDTGTDKLNSYHTFGNLLRMSEDTSMGTLRVGMWNEFANSYRYQTPQNVLTLQDVPTPKFSETYQTITSQPYAEFEFKVNDQLKITPGLKFAEYEQDYVHLQDLGKGVGTLGGTLNKTTDVITGGAPSVANTVTYRDWLPSLDAHYLIKPNWSAYAQYAAGDLIPPTSVFDVPNAAVATAPKPQKSDTLQFGTVWKSDAFTFDADIYHVKLSNAYNSTTDAAGDAIWAAVGDEITQGLEVESTIPLGGGFALYLDGSIGSTKYSGGANDGAWVSGAPRDIEKAGLFYTKGGWDSALFVQRVGKLYNDNSATVGSDSYLIDPVVLTNLFINYTIKQPSTYFKDAKVQLAINNLFDQHSITAIGGAGGTDSNSASGSYTALAASDTLTLLPARSIALSLTLDF
jgi:iron complex outermembrane receptor protein